MARATTIQALRNRGISKKTAEILADAGFTLEKLAASKPERLAKFIAKKEAEKVLKKLGTAPAAAEAKPAPKREKAKPAARARRPSAKAAEAEPEAPLTIPVKAPPLSAGGQENLDGVKGIGRWLPRFGGAGVSEKNHWVQHQTNRDRDRDDLPRGHRLDRDGPREHAGPRISGRSPHEIAGGHLAGARGEAEETR